MSNQYIVNREAQADGYHEVHNLNTCSYLPAQHNRVNIGWFSNCQDALRAAKNQYPNDNIDGCYHCCNACHTR